MAGKGFVRDGSVQRLFAGRVMRGTGGRVASCTISSRLTLGVVLHTACSTTFRGFLKGCIVNTVKGVVRGLRTRGW